MAVASQTPGPYYIPQAGEDGIIDDDFLSTGIARAAALTTHVADTGNPHQATKAQVGLGNVDNVQQLPLSCLDTDSTMAADSDIKVPSQKAVRAYVAENGGSRGLFSGLLSELPTQVSTGFETWVNQGTATAEDSDAGLIISGEAASSSAGLGKSVPASTPYAVTALLSIDAVVSGSYYPGLNLGWYDSSTLKSHLLALQITPSNVLTLYVIRCTNYYTYVSSDYSQPFHSMIFWARLYDDGTTVHFQVSISGIKWLTIYSVAKASGYLGSTGYNNIVFSALSGPACMHSYKES